MKMIRSSREAPKLTVKDRKLVQLLVQNGRSSISELAKRVGISKPAILQKITSLTQKEVMLEPVLYSSLTLPENKNLYLFKVHTSLGLNNEDVTQKIKGIKGAVGILWYTGEYNLLMLVDHEDPERVVEDLERIVPVNKLRVMKIKYMWYHPPHLFSEIPDVKVSCGKDFPIVDSADERMISYLNSHPRASLIEIATHCNLSTLTVKKRLSRLLKEGAIMRVSYYANPWCCGRDIISASFSVKGRKNTDALIKRLLEFPETGNVWELDHEWNLNAVFWVREQNRVNEILNTIYKEINGILDTQLMVLTGMTGK